MNNLVSDAPVVLRSIQGETPGKLVYVEDALLRVKVEGCFFPPGFDPELFVKEGDQWRRLFPDPFTNKQSFSQNEPLYTLQFVHKPSAP